MTVSLPSTPNLLIAIAGFAITAVVMGLFGRSKNQFAVSGKTVLITGASQGLGLAAATQLASKGANVIIVSRSEPKLRAALERIQRGAVSPTTQRFHFISADLTSAEASAQMMRAATKWNHNQPPDVVWCCAGSSTPTLFATTPPEALKEQMDANYFTAAYTAHAAMRTWLGLEEGTAAASAEKDAESASDPYHLIFTSSFVAFFTVAGYAPYTPAKSALRGLADSIAMEAQLYAGSAAAAGSPAAKPEAASTAPVPASNRLIRVATIYPATVFSEGHTEEQKIKSDLTKKLEEDDGGQTPDACAKAAIRGLERGEEMVSTAPLTRAVAASVLGGSRGVRFADRMLSWIMACFGVMAFVRRDLDRKTWNWGRDHGGSGMKRT